MSKLVFFLLLIVPSAVIAQPQQSTSNSETVPTPATPYSVTNCPKFAAPNDTLIVDNAPASVIVVTAGRFPPNVRRGSVPNDTLPVPVQGLPSDQSTTELALHLLADGTVKSAAMVKSSGNADLDGAARVCLAGKRLPPITSSGVAIEGDTTARIGWPSAALTIASQLPSYLPAGKLEVRYYPPSAFRFGHQGYAVISFLIVGDGSVRNVAVARSTGYSELDQAAVEAVSQYHYRPAVSQNGDPVAADAKTIFIWRILN